MKVGVRTTIHDGVEKRGPKPPDDPTIGFACPACQINFQAGDFTALVALGPGDNDREREEAREGRSYDAVALEVHWACATGEIDASE